MGFNLFLANKIGSKVDSTGKLSRMGSIISVLSVAVSVAVIIIAVAVADGFRKEIKGKARGFASDITLTVPGVNIINENSPLPARFSYLDKFTQLPFVESVNGVSYRHGILKTNEEIGGMLLKGVDSTYNLNFYRENLVGGALPNLSTASASNEIIISKRLADMLGYEVGDRVEAYFIGDNVRLRRFTVVGIFDAQLEQLDKMLAVGDIRHVNRLNGWGEECSGFEIYLKERYHNGDMQFIRGELDRLIYENSKDGDPALVPSSLEQRFYVLFDWLHLLDLNVVIILALMIAVAGFNMVSGLLIMLFERISQIGLLKALGMTNFAVAKIFLTKAAIVVLQGMLYGNAFAIAVAVLQQRFGLITLNPENYFVSAVPIDLNFASIIGMNVLAFLLIMAVMVLPCHFISKISPATTMRVN